MKKKYFLLVLATAGIIIAAFSLAPKYKPTREPSNVDQSTESPSTYTIQVEEEATAFDALKNLAEKENISLETQQYDFGIFVKSIDGKESSAETAWIYFVNGESGTVAADLYKLKPGDVVEWKYIKPE